MVVQIVIVHHYPDDFWSCSFPEINDGLWSVGSAEEPANQCCIAMDALEVLLLSK
jgi:hypothetical protein